MDIHRCRFVSYPPSAINAVAFSHQFISQKNRALIPSVRLAVGRANGDIEVWNPLKGLWIQETIFCGAKNRSIEGLVWTQDPDDISEQSKKRPGKLRLFSIGYSSAVTEWDLVLGRPLRVFAGNYGELWCLAVQPKSQSHTAVPSDESILSSDAQAEEQNIVVGCADGAIIVLSTSNSELQFLKTLARPSNRKARVLSITYQNRNTVIAGHADSTIRVFDTRNGQQIRSMSLGAGPQGGPKETLVWSVKCLPDGTIVSGDSTGTLKFWNGKNYTLLQRVKSHLADILDVAVTADGSTIISGGMDRRTTIYRRAGSGRKGDRRHWAEVAHPRLHKHDVKALTTFETNKMSVLVSGGLDTNPIIMPIRAFGKEHHRTISGLPLQPCVGGASGPRLMMSSWANEVNIWWIPIYDYSRTPASEESATLEKLQTRKLVAKIVIQGEESLISADLMPDGSSLAVSTISCVKLFRLRQKDNQLLVSKIVIPTSIGEAGARIVKFSPDGKWLLLIRSDSRIQICRLKRDEGARKGLFILPRLVTLERLPRDATETPSELGLGSYMRAISRVAFSADSRILAVGDLAGYLDTWTLQGCEDFTEEGNKQQTALGQANKSDDESSEEEVHAQVTFGQSWIRTPAASILPKLPSAALVLSFRPRRPNHGKQATSGISLTAKGRSSQSKNVSYTDQEDRLFVLTGEHQIYEFHVLSGKLSAWSRRNSSSQLPQAFKTIRDRAMGSIWDVRGVKERIWLYGSSWLWMFDLSLDFPANLDRRNQTTDGELQSSELSTKNLKRKRGLGGDRNSEEAGKRNTGAGDKIPDSKLYVGIGRKFRKTNGAESDKGGWIKAEIERCQSSDGDDDEAADEDDNDDEDAANESALVGLRRGMAEAARITNSLRNDEASGIVQLESRGSDSCRPYWGTHRYRDILGIVPLGDVPESDDDLRRSIEVAVVERPLHEVDLPPRYHGDQEWD